MTVSNRPIPLVNVDAHWHEIFFGKGEYPAAKINIDGRYCPRQSGHWWDRVPNGWPHFLSLGGLVAVHAQGRNREAIWGRAQASAKCMAPADHVFWCGFDLLNATDADGNPRVVPMGGETLHESAATVSRTGGRVV